MPWSRRSTAYFLSRSLAAPESVQESIELSQQYPDRTHRRFVVVGCCGSEFGTRCGSVTSKRRVLFKLRPYWLTLDTSSHVVHRELLVKNIKNQGFFSRRRRLLSFCSAASDDDEVSPHVHSSPSLLPYSSYPTLLPLSRH